MLPSSAVTGKQPNHNKPVNMGAFDRPHQFGDRETAQGSAVHALHTQESCPHSACGKEPGVKFLSRQEWLSLDQGERNLFRLLRLGRNLDFETGVVGFQRRAEAQHIARRQLYRRDGTGTRVVDEHRH